MKEQIGRNFWNVEDRTAGPAASGTQARALIHGYGRWLATSAALRGADSRTKEKSSCQ